MKILFCMLSAISGILGAAAAAAPHDIVIKLPGTAVVLKEWPSIREPAMPVSRDGTPVASGPDGAAGRFHVIEIYEQTPGTRHAPLVWADLIANMYVRPTYQKPEGPGGRLGTSVVGTTSFRTREGLRFLPEVLGASLSTVGADRIRSEIKGRFRAPAAEVVSVHRFPAPLAGRSEMRLTIRFTAREAIVLDPSARGNDAFRLVTLSSMYSDRRKFDASVLRYVDPASVLHAVRVEDLARRETHVLPRAVAVGAWFELVKEPGSEWSPDSPSIRVDIERASGVGRLGLQGYLAGTTNPNDDSLSVWLEWLDVPEIVAVDTALEIDLKITATPPSTVRRP